MKGKAWAVLGIALLMFSCYACASRQVRTGLVPIPVVFDSTIKALGIAGCDTLVNAPIVKLHPSVSKDNSMAEVLYHEMIHAKRMLAYPGGCREMMKKFRAEGSDNFRFTEELIAHCATLNHYVPKEYRESAKGQLILALWMDRRWKPMPFTEVTRRVHLECGGSDEAERQARSP